MSVSEKTTIISETTLVKYFRRAVTWGLGRSRVYHKRATTAASQNTLEGPNEKVRGETCSAFHLIARVSIKTVREYAEPYTWIRDGCLTDVSQFAQISGLGSTND